MWVWGGLILSYPQTVAERKFLFVHHLPPPRSWREGGREVPAVIFLLTGARHEGDCCPSWGLLVPIGKQLCPPWTSTPFARFPPCLVLLDRPDMPEPHSFRRSS